MVPKKAVARLEKLRKRTQAVVVTGTRGDKLPPEARLVLNKILLPSTPDSLAITAPNPTREEYLPRLTASLAHRSLLVS